MTAIFDRVVADQWHTGLLEAQIGALPVLNQPMRVDAILDLSHVGDASHLERTDGSGMSIESFGRGYAASPFFGMTDAEMAEAAPRFEIVAYVVRSVSQASYYSGGCNLRALREMASVFVISLQREDILAARYVYGPPPSQSAPCGPSSLDYAIAGPADLTAFLNVEK